MANSSHIAGKVKKIYGREAWVVYPPVDLNRFTGLPLQGSGQGGYFLWLGAFAPYKRLDLAVAAFEKLGLPLWVAGSGQESAKFLRAPSNVRLLGQVPEEKVPELYWNAKALVFTGEEDFGLTPVEAQACGRPVIALGKGGALETVTPRTGILYSEPTEDALADAVVAFHSWHEGFRPEDARKNAEKFGRPRFLEEFMAEVNALMHS